MLKWFVYYKQKTLTMKRLYKIILLFLIIFLIGIYFTVKSINNSFSSEDSIESVSISPSVLKLTTKL